MTVTEDAIRTKCLEAESLRDTSHVECEVVGGCDGGAKVAVTVVSTAFEKLPLLKRHRLVNEVFAEELKNESIHALSVKAYTPAQYEAKK
eukprot:jgi/Psemu1/302983/fgenesh1_kg.88_\